jgi:hypothetical protein
MNTQKENMYDSIDWTYFDKLVYLISKNNNEKLETYLNDEQHTWAILKLFLEDKDKFENIQPMIPESFYTNLFRCKEIFRDLSNNKLRQIKRRNFKVLEELKNTINDENILNHVLKNYLESESIILDSVIELTKDYVLIEQDKNRGIRDILSNEPVLSIYANNNKKARMFWADPDTPEYEEGIEFRASIRDNEKEQTIEIVNLINGENHCLCPIKPNSDTTICSGCGKRKYNGVCKNSYCDNYYTSKIEKCKGCGRWTRSIYNLEL